MKLAPVAALGLCAVAEMVSASAAASSQEQPKPAGHASPEPKAQAKPEAKPSEKPAGHGAPVAPAPKPEAPRPAPPPAQIPISKPSPLAKPVGGPVRSTWSAPRRTASPPPAPVPLQLAPIPVKVEVVQEAAPPARVEAVLHVVPHIPGMSSTPSAVKLPAGASHVELPVNLAAWQAASQPRLDPVGPVSGSGLAPSAKAQADPPAPPLRIPQKNLITNEGLVTLARAGYDEDFLIDLMRIKRCHFDTSVEGLAYLAGQGISERLVKAALRLEVQSRSE